MTHEAATDISAIPELARLVDHVTHTRRPQALQHEGRTVALLVPAAPPLRRRMPTTLVDTSALPPVPYRTVDELVASRPGPVVTGDDPQKQAAAAALFRQVETGVLTLRAPDTVIADAVFVLSSPRIYHLARARVRTELATLLGFAALKVHNRRLLLRALDIWATTNLDFGDAMLVATMERRGDTDLYSYDHDFDRIAGIARQEP
jgi:predicted nucleic acid-binding protein